MSIDRAKNEARDFVEHLGTMPTIQHAINHSQMETWVAIEGLEYFAARGWNCWETLGFITSRPVRQKNAKATHGFKLPDLVCVKEGLSLWWEFKAISPLALHPESAGGTFVEDVCALAGFDCSKTLAYLRNGRLAGVRDRDDSRNIKKSELEGKLGASSNVGIALLFEPDRPDTSSTRFGPKLERLNPPPDRMTFMIESRYSSATVPRGSPLQAEVPRCHAWFVNMQSGDPQSRPKV